MRNYLQYVFLTAVTIMVFLLVCIPDIEYDSYVRFEVARGHPFSLTYVHGLVFLPLYHFVESFVVLTGSFGLMRLFSLFSVVASALLVERVSKLVTGSEKTSALTATLFILNPMVLLYGSLAMSEATVTMLTLLFIYMVLQRRYSLASIVLAIGILTAYTFWMVIPFLTIYLAFDSRKRNILWLIFPIMAVVLWGGINYVYEGNPLHFVDTARTIHLSLNDSFLFQLALPIKLLLYPVIYPLAFASIPFVEALRKWRVNCITNGRATVLFTYLVTVHTCLLSIGVLTGYILGWGRYFIVLIPLYLIMGSSAIEGSKHGKVLTVAYLLIAIIGTLIQAQIVYSFRGMMLP